LAGLSNKGWFFVVSPDSISFLTNKTTRQQFYPVVVADDLKQHVTMKGVAARVHHARDEKSKGIPPVEKYTIYAVETVPRPGKEEPIPIDQERCGW
jgi:hypothetical protein